MLCTEVPKNKQTNKQKQISYQHGKCGFQCYSWRRTQEATGNMSDGGCCGGLIIRWRRPLQSLDMRGARDVYPAIHMTVSNQVLSHSTRNTLGEKYSLGVYFLLVYICQLICTNLFPLLANIKRHLLYNSKMQKKE